MTFSEELINHAIRLLGNPPDQANGESPSNADMRRAVSAAYYALFHRLTEAAVNQIAPDVRFRTSSRIYRWFDHVEMKRVCSEFASSTLNKPLSDLLDEGVSQDIQTLAVSFIRLQEARHNADYNLDYQLTWGQARDFVQSAISAIGAWERTANSEERSIFILSLLLWKNWEKSRK